MVVVDDSWNLVRVFLGAFFGFTDGILLGLLLLQGLLHLLPLCGLIASFFAEIFV
jgi:hypothetical protein